MVRRSVLRVLGLGLFNIPGAGGQTPPRADQQYQSAQPVPVAPGTSNVVRARLVLVFGPTGTINGVFQYAAGTTPGPGNPPIASITNSLTDPYGNATKQGFVSYGPGGSAVQILGESLFTYFGTAGEQPGAIFEQGQAGQLTFESGGQSPADPQALLTLESQGAGSGNRQFNVTADTATWGMTTITDTGLTSLSIPAATIDVHNGNVNLNMASPPNYPTAGKTLAQTQACLDGLIGSMINRQLVA